MPAYNVSSNEVTNDFTNEFTNEVTVDSSNDSSAPSSFLDGFHIVESDGQPVITLDKQHRFYINATARRLMGVKPYERLAIAYNSSERAIAIVRPDASLTDVQASLLATSQYNIDKRYYMYAKHFARVCGYREEDAPFHFVYERGASDGSAFVFRLSGV